MAAPYPSRASAVTAPATLEGVYRDAAAVTPSDTNGIADSNGKSSFWKALYVGGTGNVAVVLLSGASVLLSAVPAGTVLKVAAIQVKATGTTATLITALR